MTITQVTETCQTGYLITAPGGTLHLRSREEAETVVRDLSNLLAGTSIIDKIKLEVAKAYRLQVADIMSDRKPDRFVLARAVCYELCSRAGVKNIDIAHAFDVDHGTVAYGVSILQERKKQRSSLTAEIKLIEERVNNSTKITL